MIFARRRLRETEPAPKRPTMLGSKVSNRLAIKNSRPAGQSRKKPKASVRKPASAATARPVKSGRHAPFPQRAAACLRGLRAAQHIKSLSAHHGQANHRGGENQQYRQPAPIAPPISMNKKISTSGTPIRINSNKPGIGGSFRAQCDISRPHGRGFYARKRA